MNLVNEIKTSFERYKISLSWKFTTNVCKKDYIIQLKNSKNDLNLKSISKVNLLDLNSSKKLFHTTIQFLLMYNTLNSPLI